MITADNLGQIYSHEYIHEANNAIVVTEKQENEDALAEVNFKFNGHAIYVSQDFLEGTKSIYLKFSANRNLQLQKICDGFMIVDTNDDSHYVIYLELKSGYNDVKKKAIIQIPPSYFKINSCLNDFDSFNKQEYKEFALIISYPPKQYSLTDGETVNSKIVAYKQKITGIVTIEGICDYHSERLRNDGYTVFKGEEFGMDKLEHLCSNLLFDKLMVYHCGVPDKCGKAEVDLDAIIQKFNMISTL